MLAFRDGEQAYVQADLGGVETWAALPEEAWPKEWSTSGGGKANIQSTGCENTKGSVWAP